MARNRKQREDLYFPPFGEDWEVIDPEMAGWDADALEAALEFAGDRRSSGNW